MTLPIPSAHKFPWINTGTKTLLYFMKQRIKAPRVLPAPSTGDPAVDDTTRREFERVREQLTADYNDQRTALTDLEPLLYELAEQLQGWMSENENRNAAREERMLNMMLEHSRSNYQGLPGMSVPALPGYQQPGPIEQAPQPAASPYEGQLLRGEGSNPVFKIENGRKRWFVNEQAFLGAGFAWSQIRVVPKSVVDAIPAGNNIG